MGQQQLFLIVIGIILAALAVVIGFYAFDIGFRQSAADNLVDRNLTIASDAMLWKMQSDPYWGGNASYTGLEDAGMKKLFLGETTPNGCFKITTANDQNLVIEARSTEYPEIGARTTVVGDEIQVTEVFHDGTITIECSAASQQPV